MAMHVNTVQIIIPTVSIPFASFVYKNIARNAIPTPNKKNTYPVNVAINTQRKVPTTAAANAPSVPKRMFGFCGTVPAP